MGQAEVLEILEKSNVPLSSSEVARALEEAEFKIVKILNKLAEFKEVEVIEIPKQLAMKFYRCKRRMRLFYV